MQFPVEPPDEIRQAIIEILGTENAVLFDLLGMLGRIRHLIERAGEIHVKGHDLSMARAGLLMRLLVFERMGRKISPSELSKCHRVSRNTISALLSGLEDQGLIERAIDPADRRRFYIHLTDAGRDVALEELPRHARHISTMFADLTQEEIETLLRLLQKVCNTLRQRVCPRASKDKNVSKGE